MSIKIKFFLFTWGLLFLPCKQILATIPITLQADPVIACVGCQISFTVNSECDLAGATFHWDFGDGTGIITATNYTSHAYANPGSFNANVTVVKPNDSGTDNVTINIYQLGSFKIDALRVFDIPDHPSWFHIHAYQTELKDSNGNNWDPISSHPRVRYEWYNCWDGRYFPSGYASAYTFESIFTFSIKRREATDVQGHVFCEKKQISWFIC